MDDFELNVLEKETNDFHNPFYQNVKHYKERENAFIKKNYKCGIYFPCLCYKTRGGGRMTEIFE